MPGRILKFGKFCWIFVLLSFGFALGSFYPTRLNAQTPSQTPIAQADDLRQIWSPVLGAEGSQVVDHLISEHTPNCLRADEEESLHQQGAELRSLVAKGMLLDYSLPVRSSVFQQQHEMDDYRIDVVRLEVIPNLYMSANIYSPATATEKSVPLVVLIPGCDSGVHSPYVQQMGANLARMGMVVLVTEGFCSNGARTRYDGNHQYSYASQMLGGVGLVEIFTQELISAITWIVEEYSIIDDERIGAAGYSYGGQMSLILAALDTRVVSVSVPATYIGDPCDNFLLAEDIWVEDLYPITYPDFSWSAPLRLPIQPINWRIFLLYPRALHTTAGFGDAGAHPSFVEPVMGYAQQLYQLGGHEDRLLYLTDNYDHYYYPNRREDTYAWLAHTLLGEPLTPHIEMTTTLLSAAQLFPDLSGTLTSQDLASALVDAEFRRREEASQSLLGTGDISQIMQELFASVPLTLPITSTLVWQRGVEDVFVQTYRVEASGYIFPLFFFENVQSPNSGRVLFLATNGVYQDLEEILTLLKHYRTVISIDYLGIGELKSNRLLLHTFTRYFMHHSLNIPQMNVGLLNSLLPTVSSESLDVYATSWPTAFYAFSLKALTPTRVGSILPNGVPASELDFLRTGQKIPDLLLWTDLFSKVTVGELAAAFTETVAIQINGDAANTTSVNTVVTTYLLNTGVTSSYLQLSNDASEWTTFHFTSTVEGVPWTIFTDTQPTKVYARLIDVLGRTGPVVWDTIHYIDVGGRAPGVSIQNNVLFINTHLVTLTLTAPTHTSLMAIRDSAQLEPSFSPDDESWVWEPYHYTRTWQLTDYGVQLPHRIVYAQFRDINGTISPTFLYNVILDETPPSGSIRLNKGARATNTATLTATLTADDDLSGVHEVQIGVDSLDDDAPWLPFSLTFTVTLTNGDGVKTVYARFRDQALNISSIVSDTVLLDTTPPTGSFQINGGALTTSQFTVTLNLTVTDALADGIEMQVAKDPSFVDQPWLPFASLIQFGLVGKERIKTIYVRFRDRLGNTSAPVSASIELRANDKIFLPLVSGNL
jgi:hypothetical protein